jgi:hypothetical protein
MLARAGRSGTRPTDRRDHRWFAWAVQLSAQIAHVDVDDVRLGVEVVTPDGGQDLFPAQYLAGMAHEVGEQSELPGGEVEGLIPSPGAVRQGVDDQITRLEERR